MSCGERPNRGRSWYDPRLLFTSATCFHPTTLPQGCRVRGGRCPSRVAVRPPAQRRRQPATRGPRGAGARGRRRGDGAWRSCPPSGMPACLCLVGIFQSNILISILSASGMVLGGGYALWLFNRIAFGNIKLHYIDQFSDINR